MRIEFNDAGDFEAYNEAKKWCNNNGYSVGSMCGPEPIGLKKGEHYIGKWRNLSQKDLNELDGTMTGNMRDGPIVIEIKD